MNTPTTYSDLTGDASAQLARALELLGGADDQASGADQGPGPAQINAGDAAAAHRDMTSALIHLGRTLLQPVDDGSGTRSRLRNASRAADAALLERLSPWAQPRDWCDPHPNPQSPAGCLTFAARLTRAAADLWSTHRGTHGGPRSPEASRMRHPSMLGAATREWRDLVAATAAVADRIQALQASAPLADPLFPTAANASDFPTPTPTRRAAADDQLDEPRGRVDLTVARPGSHPTADPILAIRDRVDHLRRMSWILAESGSAPIPILANAAAIGVLLASATAHVQRLAAEQDADPTTALDHAAGVRPDAAEVLGRRWSELARLVADLRSAHPPTTAIQVERVDLARLLTDVTRRAHRGEAREVADSLASALQAYTDVARHLGIALRAAYDRGEVYLRGRALPAHVLPRHSDLLEAKLADRPVPIPASMLRQVESAFVEIHGGSAPDRRRRPRRRPRNDDHSPAA